MLTPGFKFLHCSDLHLDSPFVGIGSTAPAIAAALRDATFKAFDNIVGLAIERQVDFIIVAGDVYDSEDRSLRAQLRFRDGLGRASAEGIQCFVAHGNHDPLSGWEARLSMPDGTVRFGGPAVERHIVEKDGIALAAVYGVSYAVREVKANLAAQFQRSTEDPFRIGVLHCNVGGMPEHDNYAPCTLDDLCRAGMNYWALGHIHARTVLRPADPCVVYPGNSQGRNVRELGARGCVVVSVGSSGTAQIEPVDTDVIRWSRREVSIKGMTTIDSLIDHVAAAKEAERANARGRGVVLGLTLAGRGELHEQLIRADVLGDLTQRLQEGEAERADFVWIHSVEMETRLPINTAERREVPDFVGEYLRVADVLGKATGAAKEIRAVVASAPGFSHIRAHVEKLTDEEVLDSLTEAESYGLDRLLGEPD